MGLNVVKTHVLTAMYLARGNRRDPEGSSFFLGTLSVIRKESRLNEIS